MKEKSENTTKSVLSKFSKKTFPYIYFCSYWNFCKFNVKRGKNLPQ